MTSNESWVGRAEKVLMNNVKRLPVAIVKGEGCWVWDADGKRYLDWVAGVAVDCLGHAYPRLLKVVQEQAQQLVHISNLYQIPRQIELAERLVELSFADRAFFCNSGAEANEAALKLARKYFKVNGQPDRYEIICMNHSFHGRTMAMISASGQKKLQKGFEPLVSGFSHVPFGDFEALAAAVTEKTAGIWLEPIQGEGGISVASDEYFRKVRALCDEKGVLLLYDEIQTGIGRTGKMFAYEQVPVVPDILTLAKGLGGGFPIGVLLASEKVSSAFLPGDHSSTFGGNPFVTRIAAEILTILEESVLENCVKVGAYFFNRLADFQKKYSIIKEVRGKGLMIGVVLDRPGAEFVLKGLEQGILINCTQENVLRFVPPLILSEEEVDWGMKQLEKIFKEF